MKVQQEPVEQPKDESAEDPSMSVMRTAAGILIQEPPAGGYGMDDGGDAGSGDHTGSYGY